MTQLLKLENKNLAEEMQITYHKNWSSVSNLIQSSVLTMSKANTEC